jgi:hypothetical protein
MFRPDAAGFRTGLNSDADPVITFEKNRWKLMPDPDLIAQTV